jgi:hypothetical protein
MLNLSKLIVNCKVIDVIDNITYSDIISLVKGYSESDFRLF